MNSKEAYVIYSNCYYHSELQYFTNLSVKKLSDISNDDYLTNSNLSIDKISLPVEMILYLILTIE